MISDIYVEDDRPLRVAMVLEMERKMERLKNKNILITGGTRGIGLASAQEFEREGARVAICGTDEKTLKEARTTLGPKALAFSADVSKLSDLDGLYSQIKAEFGHLDAVFANAGYSQFGPFEVVAEDTFDKLVAVNLKGVFFTIQKAIPLLKSGSSVIIKDRQRAKKLGSVRDYPRESQIKPMFAEFMGRLNAGNSSPEASITLAEFVEK